MAAKMTKHDEIVLWLYDQTKDIIAAKYGADYEIISAMLEKPICAGHYSRIVGYVDLFVSAAKGGIGSHDSLFVLFEAKPEIPDLGALLRQLRKYETHVRNDLGFGILKIVVVSPDTQWVEILHEQGFDFLQYQP